MNAVLFVGKNLEFLFAYAASYFMRHWFVPASQLFLISKQPLSFSISPVAICAIDLCQRFGVRLVLCCVLVRFVSLPTSWVESELRAYHGKGECLLLQSSWLVS